MVLIVYYDGTTKEEIKRIFKEFKKEEKRRNQDVERIGKVNVKSDKDE